VQESLLQEGLDITLFGMGIVFVFLFVLVVCTGIMSRIITRYFPEAEPIPLISSTSASGAPADSRLRAIIKAAVAQHRKKR
jgi:oxaloacetate decarboxylase (Na+ extruding) subunit gamma